ncbi:phosphatidylinositol N-acetylglucosaminyltransferase subunit P-like [Pomacea canaliculata]|uniref:phosphatidylinositol N-acetylglucosaminyltransferase subunit P-like n=1 Tax=Pomacea canaliculata TaxID=400727 RepID=UPI000D7383FD|nr:phosphatidylinositol N-acetylglucosaminyltransferase subunit P-like [Pomacea canaliculata]
MPQEHKPSPTPERAVQGFALYLASSVGFGLYIVWSYIPDSWFKAVGLTYWPQKYWAVAVPVYLCTLLLLGYLVYLGLIFINTPPLSSVTTITDGHANYDIPEYLPSDAIPPLCDLDITEVNRLLYTDT